MRTSLRALAAVTTALAVGIVPNIVPWAPAAQPATAAPARAVEWTPCRDGFQCATVQVPLDYDKPAGAQISLAVIRLPAGDPSRRIGSLFMNPGGPGGSGVEFVRAIAAFLPLELRGRFDIVGFDPRGIQGSTPLRCFDTLEEALATLPPFAFPVTTQEENVQREADRALAAACAARGGDIRDHMSTADVARDMDRLRHLLGDRKLSYLGFSYGSFLGQVYANLFPQRVRAVAIDGVLDPVAWSTGRGRQGRTVPFSTRLRSDVGAQATLNEFFRLCNAAGDDCAFSGRSRQRFAALARRLRQQPIVIEDPEGGTFTFGYAGLVGLALGAMYSTARWPVLAELLLEIERLATPAELGHALAAVRTGLGLHQPEQQEEYPNVVESLPGVACSDSVNPRSFNAWRRAADRSERRFGYFGRPWTWVSSSCLPWPASAGKDRHLGPWNARTASPVLVVGNFFDPATPYHGAVVAARLLPNSRLLSYAGWGHTAFFAGNFCIDDHITRYLVTTRVPRKGTVCRPAGTPFEPLGPTVKARADLAAVLGVPMLPPSVRAAVGAD